SLLRYPAVPIDSVGEILVSELDMDDSPVAGCRGGGGGVERQRAHDDYAARVDGANHLGHARFPLVELVIEPAVAVRAGKHAERTIRGPAVIQVDTDGDHAAEDLGRRLNLPDARLVRPAGESGQIEPAVHSDHVVLMPE